MHYENGDIVEISIDNDIEVSGWWNPKEIPNAKIAYETSNLVAKSVGLYCYRWKNPKPDIKIKINRYNFFQKRRSSINNYNHRRILIYSVSPEFCPKVW